jgi:hypothetical protein
VLTTDYCENSFNGFEMNNLYLFQTHFMDKKPAKIYKDFKDDKPFFASYLSMARGNAYITLHYIAERVGSRAHDDEEHLQDSKLWQALESTEKPDVSQRIVKLLDAHFPFLRVMLQHDETEGKLRDEPPTHQQYADVMKMLLTHLNSYRNYYTHAEHTEPKTDRDVIYRMRTAFDAARREAKKRFSLTDADVEHLVRLKSEGRGANKKVVEKEGYIYSFLDSENKLTEKGLAYFICLFLEKDYAYEFLKKLRDFKDSRTADKQATAEVFTLYRIRIPQVRLQSDEGQIALMLDMINELKRCPAPLHDVLNPDDKKRFDTQDDAEGDEMMPQMAMKRKEERFSYFALRYLDETQALPTLRFQVDLGNYYHKVYPKVIDGETRWRRLHKGLKSFGRLNEFNMESRPKEWTDITKKTHELPEDYDRPYIADTTAHYHSANNQIAMKLCATAKGFPKLSEKPWNVQPDIWISEDELPAMVFYDWLDRQVRTNKTSAAQSLILGHRTKIGKLLSDIKEGNVAGTYTDETLMRELNARGLKQKQVPDDLIGYLLGIHGRSYHENAAAILKGMAEETEKRLEGLERDRARAAEKPGKKLYRPLRPGHIADWLAHDLIRLQPPHPGQKDKTNTGRANSTEFQVLQARLARYGSDRDLLPDAFRMCGLILSENPHPFLHKINVTNHHGMYSFYQAYLVKRKEYITGCMKAAKYEDYHFLRISPSQRVDKNASYYQSLAGKLHALPVSLPRGLFKDALVEWFKLNGSPDMKAAANARANSVYLIQKYFETERHDKYQLFYEWKRNYKVLDKIHDKGKTQKSKSRKGLPKLYFSPKELSTGIKSFQRDVDSYPVGWYVKDKSAIEDEKEKLLKQFNDFTEDEKLIRHIRASDMALFVMALDIIKREDKQLRDLFANADFKLTDIVPDSEKGILSKTVAYEIDRKYECTLEKDKTLYAQGSRVIRESEMKIKNYGDFRRFVKDRRIDYMLPYLKEETIMKADIKKELEEYEAVRQEVFDIVYQFEDNLIRKHKQEIASLPRKENGDNKWLDHRTILTWFWEKYTIADPMDEVINIRNRFDHNKYPDFDLFQNKIESTNLSKKSVAGQFRDILSKTYGSYIKLLA